jgi:hypothetical protein
MMLASDTRRGWMGQPRRRRACWAPLSLVPEPCSGARRLTEVDRERAGRTSSDCDDVVGLRAVVCELGRTRELSVLAFKVCFGHRTGSCAAPSDVHGDAVVDDLAKYFTNVRPADRVAGVGDLRLHQVHGLSHEEDLRLVARFPPPFAPRKGRAARVGSSEAEVPANSSFAMLFTSRLGPSPQPPATLPSAWPGGMSTLRCTALPPACSPNRLFACGTFLDGSPCGRGGPRPH